MSRGYKANNAAATLLIANPEGAELLVAKNCKFTEEDEVFLKTLQLTIREIAETSSR